MIIAVKTKYNIYLLKDSEYLFFFILDNSWKYWSNWKYPLNSHSTPYKRQT